MRLLTMKKTWKWVGLLSLGLFSLVLVAAWLWVRQSPVLATAVGRKVEEVVGIAPVDPFAGKPALTVLILGCDADYSRGGKRVLRKYARSDMMLVARFDFAAQRVAGLSIPRDTLVAVNGYPEQKINAYHSLGGPDLAKQAVENLLGLRIDRVIVLDFDAFQRMVDAVGGVEIDVKKRMKWVDRAAKLTIDLKPGKQVLGGYDAMGFVRFRHTDSDLHRTERQRQFLMAFRAAVQKKPFQLPNVINQAAAVVNGAFSPVELVALAEFAQKLGDGQIQMSVVPTFEVQGYNLRVDSKKLTETLTDLAMNEQVPASR